MKAASLSEKMDQPALSRREVLNLAWLGSLGFFLLPVGGVTILFAYPRFRAGEFGGAFEAGTIAGLPAVGSAPQNFPAGRFWLSYHEKGLNALYKVCTHLGCIYNWQDAENKFLCPCHGSQFQRDGEYIQGPAPRSLDRFVVQIVDAQNNVLAETDELGNPLPIPENPGARILVDTGSRILGQPHA